MLFRMNKDEDPLDCVVLDWKPAKITGQQLRLLNPGGNNLTQVAKNVMRNSTNFGVNLTQCAYSLVSFHLFTVLIFLTKNGSSNKGKYEGRKATFIVLAYFLGDISRGSIKSPAL